MSGYGRWVNIVGEPDAGNRAPSMSNNQRVGDPSSQEPQVMERETRQGRQLPCPSGLTMGMSDPRGLETPTQTRGPEHV